MKLISLRVRDFRGIEHETVSFGDGITVVAGRNEAGKTSLVDAFDFLIKHKASSTRNEIHRARPVQTEAGPEVEAAFIIGDEQVSYRKRWLTKPETVLTFTAGPRAGKTLVADEAHAAAEELWSSLDGQLWEASRLMQASALDQSPLSSCTALQRALEAQAGGTVDDGSSAPLMERVSAEADKYFQPKRGGYSRLTKAAIDRVVAAEKQVSDAKEALDELSDLVAKLTDLEADINERESDLKDQRRHLDELSEAAESAKAYQDALDRATTELESAQRDCDDARAQLAAREGLVTATNDATASLDDLLAAEAEAKEMLAPLETSVTESREAITHLKSQLSDKKRDLQSARRFEEHSRTRADVDKLKGQLADSDRLTKDIAHLETQLVRVDDASLDRLVDLDHDIAVAEAAAQAGAAHVRVEAVGDAQTLLVGGDERVVGPDSFEQAVLDEVVIELPGQLRVTVTPDTGAGGSRRDIDRLREERQDILDGAGVTSTAELKDALRRFAETTLSIERLKERRSDRLDGRDEGSIRDELARLMASLERNADAVEGDVEALTARQDQLDVEREAAEAILDSRQREAEKLTKRLAETAGQVTNQRAVVARAERELADARSHCPDDEVTSAFTAASDALSAAKAAFREAEKRLAESGGAVALKDYELQVRHVEGLHKMLAQTKQEWHIASRLLEEKKRDSIQDTHNEADRELDRAVAERDSILARAEAARLLEEVLARHQKETRRRYIEPFRVALRDLGRATYQDPTFDVDVSDELVVDSRSMGGVTLPFDNLSTGAKEQMSILIRLATASLVSPDDAVPILFDDTLGYSDRSRLRRIVDTIESRDGVGQIIIFTANEDRFAGLDSATRVRI